MLADDSVTAQNMGRKILADAGYEVLTVNNGSAALKKIAEAKPELIVLDVYMPGYSGLEVCQRLKETQETARIPVLLTVGKLEPFKPEEAKRVHADAFIVKPFEASELLSALSKLEDKIVPGRESSKPGRFARANAAIEEGRYDKTMAIEEDSGWKNRIAFPSKKKKKAEEQEDGDDPAIYNAVNKDLRTVIERQTAPGHAAQEDRVNLEALAPEGLPKDVTPEEIAALAAAAAQIQSTVAENKEAEAVPQTAAPSEAAVATPAPVNQADVETIDLNVAAIRKAQAEVAEIQAQEAPAAEAQQPGVAHQLEVAKEPEAVATASIAEVPKPECEKPAEVPAASAQEGSSTHVPQGAELMAALTSVEPQIIASASSGNGVGSHEAADVPITMAVAAGAEHAVIPSRWTAVSVPLSSDESGLSLEQEMQKAQAASAAAEAYSEVAVAPEPPVSEPPATEPAGIESVVTESAVTAPISDPEPAAEKAVSEPEPELEPAVTSEVAPEVSETATAIDSMTSEAINAAVKELEAVAASYEGHRPFPSEPEGSAPTEEPSAAPHAAEPEPAPSAPVAESEPVRLQAEPAPEAEPQTVIAETKTEEPAAGIEETATIEEPTPEPVSHSQDAAPESSIEAPGPSHQHTEPVPSAELSAGRTTERSNKESEIAETTAAAWASWRRIRESSDPKSTHSEDNDRADAAMAVAAGAEKTPEDANSGEEGGEIASIVDSVLADLRPKIVEEISRKLGKKK